MARYTGPTHKKSRRYGFSTLENNKEFAKGKQRAYPPGQHGLRRVRPSDYRAQLHEKQKVMFTYNVRAKQFKTTFVKAHAKGASKLAFRQRLESRLDNLVYRSGFGETRRHARQLVSYGLVLLNGKRADVPSQIVKLGAKVSLKPKAQKNKYVLQSLENRPPAPWITLDKEKMVAEFERLPITKELPKINDGLIIEFYSR